MSGERDDWMAIDLERAADKAAAEAPTVDWEALGTIEREARSLAASKRLTGAAVDGLMDRARGKVPRDRGDVLSALERDLRALL